MQFILYILFFTPLVFHSATANTNLNSSYEDYGLHEELDNTNISKKFNQLDKLLTLGTNFTPTPSFIENQNTPLSSTTMYDLEDDQQQSVTPTTAHWYDSNPSYHRFQKSFSKFKLPVGLLTDKEQKPGTVYDVLYVPQEYWGCKPFIRGVREECKYYGDCCQDPMRVWEQLHPQTFTCIHIPNQRKKGKANVFLL